MKSFRCLLCPRTFSATHGRAQMEAKMAKDLSHRRTAQTQILQLLELKSAQTAITYSKAASISVDLTCTGTSLSNTAPMPMTLHVAVAVELLTWSVLKLPEKTGYLFPSQNLGDLDAQQRPRLEEWRLILIQTLLCRHRVTRDDRLMPMEIQRKSANGVKPARRRARRLRTSPLLRP